MTLSFTVLWWLLLAIQVWWQAGTPALAGNRPVRRPAREAEQMADGASIWVNLTPVAARRSRFGVSRSSEP